jgi:hypothetical protein
MITCRTVHLRWRCRERGYTWDEVQPCIVSQDGDSITVDVDHPAYPRIPKEGHKPEPESGPGAELKALLAKFGIQASPTCKCNSMARKMNEWGEESLEHIDEIVDVMQETAKARSLPFLRAAGVQLVKAAVRRWKKANSK